MYKKVTKLRNNAIFSAGFFAEWCVIDMKSDQGF